MGRTRTRMYRKGVLEADDFGIHEISEHMRDPDAFIWVDHEDPTVHDLEQLAAELGLHELAVEDALEPHQRPKLDHYVDHLFLSCHAVRVGASPGHLDVAEIDAFIGPRWLVTTHSDNRAPMDEVVRRWDRSPDLAVAGVSFLLYGLLDVVVDSYFGVVEAFDDHYDAVSDRIFAERPMTPDQQRRWFESRRALMRFHRLVGPMREVVSSLMRHEQEATTDGLYPYYQDIYDHVLRVSEATDSLRDLVAGIVETNLSLRDYRQNLVMKKVTSWAAIIAVPTLVTGYYGMNVPYPGSGGTAGVITSGLLIVVLSGALYLLFRQRDWL